MRRQAAFILFASAATIGLSAPAHAADPAPDATADTSAQDNDAAAAQDSGAAAAPADAGAADATITVTGTRIVRNGYTAPTPVTVAPTEELVKLTPSNIPDALNKLPQFQNSLSPSRAALNFSNAPIHGNVLNLRGLGTTGANPKGPLRTLILFDRVRVPPTEYVGTIDTNVLPQLLISRVDVVTGGASAQWGSDAVAGVVNFILDKKFTGVKGVLQAGVAERGDNPNQRIGAAAGFNFGADDRGHVEVSGEYYHNGGMLRAGRDYATRGYDYVGKNPGAGAPGTAANPYVIGTDIRISALAPSGRITASSVAGNPFVGQVINPDGSLRPFNTGTPVGTTGFQSGGDGYKISTLTNAVAPLKTYQTFGRVSYEVAPQVSAYVQGIWSRSDLQFISQTNALVPPSEAVNIYKGNPYLSAALNAALPTANDFYTVGQYDAGQPGPISNERTDFWMVTAGLEGKLAGLDWALDYTHGDSEHRMDASGLYENKKLYAAVDAVRNASGQIVCRVSLDPVLAPLYPGCTPVDFLHGNANVSTPAGYDYVTGTSRYDARIKHDAVDFTVSGSLFDLPAGPVDFALGAEYRHQSLNLDSNADPATLAGSTPAETAAIRSAFFNGLRGVPAGALYYWLTNVGVANGTLEVKEAYGELAIPILKDTPGFQELSLSAAGRITDYSSSGTVETWKVGATWRPIRDILVRGTYSRDIRAPNLFELYAGLQAGIGIVNDVKNASGTYGSGQNVNVNSVTGGNPDLKPEVAKTWTVGTVVSPQFLRGFSFSIDYYNIKVDKLIDSLSAQQILTNCLNAGGSGVPECSLIDRATPTTFPSLVRIVPANIAFLKTAGVDFDATYRSRIGSSGDLAVRLYANYLDRFDSQQYPGAPVLHYAGVNVVSSNPAGYPRWRGQLSVDYSTQAGFGLSVSEQYIDHMTLGIPGANQVFEHSHVPAVFYTDLGLRQELHGYGGKIEAFLTINNLFDKKPPLIPGTVPGVNLPTNIALYDFVGRAFTAGVRFRF